MEGGGFDFEELTPERVAAKKKNDETQAAQEKATKSVEQTRLRKAQTPPSEAEIRRLNKDAKEMVAQGSLEFDKNRVAKVKTTCQLYLNYFSDKYPEIKKFVKPSEKDGLAEWQQYLSDLQNIIGGKKADSRFDTALAIFAAGVEKANVEFPHLFGFYNLNSPLSFSKVVTSPEFLAEIDDEKHEFIFTHQSWFSSSYLSRLVESVAKAGMAVALKNKELRGSAAVDEAMAAAQPPAQ
jgi:hypothetical protein